MGSYLPERVVTNEEIAPRMDSTPEWIVSHTGIVTRHVAAASESASTMGVEAARTALANAGVAPEDVGMIILSTTMPDYGNYPSTACLVQGALGCVNAAAFDLAAACSGFVYGLEMAKCYLLCHPERKAIVICSEILSRQIDWADRSNAMLFGDGAAAVVLAAEEGADANRSSAVLLGADGNGAPLIVRECGCGHPFSDDPVHATSETVPMSYLKMDGHAVFTFAVRKLDEVVRALCAKSSLAPESLDLVVAHQANRRILESVARRMKLPMEKFYLNLTDVGNTSSASIPLCLDKAVREGVLKDGMHIVVVGFGAGLTWAGALLQWPYL